MRRREELTTGNIDEHRNGKSDYHYYRLHEDRCALGKETAKNCVDKHEYRLFKREKQQLVFSDVKINFSIFERNIKTA